MEIIQPRARASYYFSLADKEILEERLLALSCDEDTWLYKVDGRYGGQYKHFELGSPFQDQKTPPIGGSVDSRTYTRRKHCALRPSLESVVESPLSNSSSLGVLGASKLLNDTPHYMQTPHLANREKTSSSFIGSEENPLPRSVFKLDSPFNNTGILGGNRCPPTSYTFERARLNSDASDVSAPYSLGYDSLLDKNGLMTDSLTNFLEKQEVSSQAATQPENQMTESIISLPENCELGKKDNIMTDSMHSFLEPVNCIPPSGFRGLESTRCNSPAFLIKSTATSETENIPPSNVIIGDNHQNIVNSIKRESRKINLSYDIEKSCDNLEQESRKIDSTFDIVKIGDSIEQESKTLNSTYDIEKNKLCKLEGGGDTTYEMNNKLVNVTFTNTVNTSRVHKDKSNFKEELNMRTLNSTYGKEISSVKDLSDKSLKLRTLNNKDLNETLNVNKQIPSRNSTFNTTFTKMSGTMTKSSHLAGSTDVLNGEGLDEDRTSSASDSSFSSDSTKPRSVDELRTIARQQESSLAQQTSTPTESKFNTTKLVEMDIELSPIRRLSMGGRPSESRSANCSPVRSHAQPHYNHPISRLKQPAMEFKQQMVPASSMSNIARPRPSGLRMPRPVSTYNGPQRSESRPFTAPGPTHVQPPQGIPRPQISRLPMPRFRGSSIPGPRRGCL